MNVEYVEALRLIQDAARRLQKRGDEMTDTEKKIHIWAMRTALIRITRDL